MANELISADAHVNPPPPMWADYLLEKYKAEAPVLEEFESESTSDIIKRLQRASPEKPAPDESSRW